MAKSYEHFAFVNVKVIAVIVKTTWFNYRVMTSYLNFLLICLHMLKDFRNISSVALNQKIIFQNNTLKFID